MNYGDIILFKPMTFRGRLISLIDGSPYSHIGMFLRYDANIPLFIESDESTGGVVIMQLQDWQNYIILKPVGISPRPIEQILEKLGTPYDTIMILDILLAKIFKRNKQNNNENKFICSEFIDYCYNYKIGQGNVATLKTFYQSKLFTQ